MAYRQCREFRAFLLSIQLWGFPHFSSMWCRIFYICTLSEVSDFFYLLHQEAERMWYSISLLNFYPYYLSFQEWISWGFSREDFYPKSCFYQSVCRDFWIFRSIGFLINYKTHIELGTHKLLTRNLKNLSWNLETLTRNSEK